MSSARTLGESDRHRLEQLREVEKSSSDENHGSNLWGQHRGLLIEVVKRFKSAKDDRSRHEALLSLFAALSSPLNFESNSRQGQRHLIGSEFKRLVEDLDLVQLIIQAASNQSQDADLTAHCLIAEVALASLELLSRETPNLLGEEVLIFALAFTEPRNPWTTETASESAALLITKLLPHQKLDEFLVDKLIQDHIRPIVLEARRQSIRQDRATERRRTRAGQTVTKYWKSPYRYALSVFRWVVKKAETRIIASHWHLFLPILLASLDDSDLQVKEIGLETLVAFLRACPSQTLRSSGMVGIFENAAFSLLLPLSDSSGAQDSLATVCLAYDVVLLLGHAYQDSQHLERRRLLDRLIRDGILTTYLHASNDVAVVKVLMQYTEAIVKSLGIFAIKHLKVLLDIIEAIMTDPFAMMRPSTVLTAGHALNAVLFNCWPRIQSGRQDQVMRIIAICWVNSHDHMQSETQPSHTIVKTNGAEVCEVLLTSSRLLQSVRQGQEQKNIRRKLDSFAKKEPMLAPLLLYHTPS